MPPSGKAEQAVKFLFAVLLRIGFTWPRGLPRAGELLPRLSILTAKNAAVYFCCTCPEVAFGGRYPLSLLCGARTFLTAGPFGMLPRDRSGRSV